MIIVTGGAGFIGSNIVRGLNDRGWDDILIVDNLQKGEKFKNLLALRFADYQDKSEFIKDVGNGKFDKEEIDAIIHQGACTDTMEQDANYILSNNYQYSKELLHFCLRRGIPFIYASSASVYGRGHKGFREEEGCEEALNLYAFSKLLFDRYVRRILPGAKSQVVGLRYFNVFGPQENHKGRMASIVYQLYCQLVNSGVAQLFRGTDGWGDGEQRRDYVYVKDVVKVNLFFLENPDKRGIYNCGTGRAITFNEVANTLIKLLGRGEIKYVEFPSQLQGKYQSFTEADLGKLRRAGYTGRFMPFEEAVIDYYHYLETVAKPDDSRPPAAVR